jgi:hypothetical protein
LVWRGLLFYLTDISIGGAGPLRRLLRIILRVGLHLRRLISHLLDFLNLLFHLLDGLLKPRIFWRDTTHISETLSDQATHLLAFPRRYEQADSKSNKHTIAKTTHLELLLGLLESKTPT